MRGGENMTFKSFQVVGEYIYGLDESGILWVAELAVVGMGVLRRNWQRVAPMPLPSK